MKAKTRKILSAMVMLTLFSSAGFADKIERRKDQFGRDFGYYVYPIAGEIPGLGKASGIGASVLNMGGGDTDFTGYYVRGDFNATGAALLDYHILPQRLIFDVGYNDYLVAPRVHKRGIDSDPLDVIYPKVEGAYLLGQLTLTFDQRRYELFTRMLGGKERVLGLLDKDGKAYTGIDTTWKNIESVSVGGSYDLTDDRLDPRKGVRFELSSRLPSNYGGPDSSQYFVNDYNLTGYIPMHRWDTLALNVYHSRAYVTREGLTDYNLLQQRYGLNCNQYPPGPNQNACLAAEAKLLAGTQANNQYGTASALGGTQRLRSFDNGRFYAGQALSYGLEYRWNLTDERTPFNIYVAKGVRTGIQLAAFWERGTVSDRTDELLKNGRTSYGIGARLILSGVIIRFDLAHGDEGAQTQLFITYPWSMFSVDKPN